MSNIIQCVRVVLLHDGGAIFTRREAGIDTDLRYAPQEVSDLFPVPHPCDHAGGLQTSCPSYFCELAAKVRLARQHPAGVWAVQMNDLGAFAKGGPACRP